MGNDELALKAENMLRNGASLARVLECVAKESAFRAPHVALADTDTKTAAPKSE